MLDYLPLPLSFFVRSEIRYVEPGVGVGGSGFPRTPVTSSPVRPPLGPTRSYCPDAGAFWPGFSAMAAPCTSSRPIPRGDLTGIRHVDKNSSATRARYRRCR